MTSTSASTDNAALSLMQNIKEGIGNGRIADLTTARTELDAAIAELNSRQTARESSHISDLVGKLHFEIGSLHEKVAKCEAQLADFQLRTRVLKEDTTQIVARADACSLLVERQQKENSKVLAAMEAMKTGTSTAVPLCTAPLLSPETHICHAPTRAAVVSFPGGPRTVTIHPPDSPSFQPIIHDDKGEVILDFRRTKPLRREGAFRSSLEEIDWRQITRVCGRGPERPGVPAPPPSPRWPDHTQPPSNASARHPSEIIARQRQLSISLHTDTFGRVLAPEYLSSARSPSLPTGMSSSYTSLPDSQTCGAATVPSSPTTPSPTVERRKRVRKSEDDEDGLVTTEDKEPIIPAVKCEDEGHGKRRRLRSSPSSEGLSPTTKPLSRT